MKWSARLSRWLAWEPEPGTRAGHLIGAGHVAACFAALLALYIGASLFGPVFFWNADLLWIEDFLRDWLERGVDPATWMLPGASNFIPDMLLYAAVRVVAPDVFWTFVLFGLARALFFGLILYALVSLLTSMSKTRRWWFCLSCTTWMLLWPFLSMTNGVEYGNEDFLQVFMPAFHGGALVLVLMALVLVCAWLRSPRPAGPLLAGLFVISLSASFSDRLFVLWFSLPAMAALWLLVVLHRIRWQLVAWISFCLILADWIGRRLLLAQFPSQQFPYLTSPAAGAQRVLELLPKLDDFGWYNLLVLISGAALLTVTAVTLSNELRRRATSRTGLLPHQQQTAVVFILTWASLLWPSTLVGMILISRAEVRYLVAGNLAALAFWPFLLALWPPGLRLWRKGLFQVAAILLVIPVLTVLAGSAPAWQAALLRTPEAYSPLVACLDANARLLGGGVGLADYWEARLVNVFSRAGLRVDQAQGDSLLIRNTNASSDMLLPKKRTFVIADTPTFLPPIRESQVVELQGEPSRRIVCAGFPVLVYDDGLENLGEGLLHLESPHGELQRIASNPAGLIMFTQVGEWHAGRITSTGEAGALLYGPYLELPTGEYVVTWYGCAPADNPGPLGFVDISGDAGLETLARRRVKSAPTCSEGQQRITDVAFTLERPTRLIEFKFIIEPGVNVEIESVVVRLNAP